MDGILPLWKEAGMTSHDCVFKVRKILRMKKVGHTGTLDPDVDGVLPICLGRATKVAEYITDAGKSYLAEVKIGKATVTEDASGEIIEAKPVLRPFEIKELNRVLSGFTGEIQQTPPIYSAVKVNGKRLYEYARQGLEVKRPTRTVRIHKIELDEKSVKLEDDTCTFTINVKCGKGTYIRTLAVMIGEALGYPAHMSKLTRTSSAGMTRQDCLTLSQLAELASDIEDVQERLLPIESGVSQLMKLNINDKVASKVKNGAVMEIPEDWDAGPQELVVFLHKNRALAIYHLHPSKEGLIKPVKVLWTD